MTFDEACRRGMERVREPQWPPDAYLRLVWGGGSGWAGKQLGFWLELYSRTEQAVCEFETPQMVSVTSINQAADELEEYRGEPDPADLARHPAQREVEQSLQPKRMPFNGAFLSPDEER